jgi:mannosyltransferase
MANVAGVRATTDTTRRTDTGGWGAPWEWVVSAAVTLVVCLIGIGSSPLWQDELATWSATNRSLPELARLSAHKDAVLTPYYALMHVWTSVVGFTPVSLRLLSAIAMSAAAGVLAALGARLWGRGRGLFAGFMLAALPAVSYYGQDARPYALVVLAAVAGTAALVGALADARRGLWAAYAGCLIALGALQLTALTLVAAHGVTAWHDAWRRGCRWPRQWLIASGGALAVLSPLLVVGALSRRQVAWIDAISVETLASLPGLFGTIGVAVVVVALAGIGVVRSPATRVVAAPVAIVPILALLTVSAVVPMFLTRYVLFTLAGWALLSASALISLPRWLGLALVIGTAILGLGAQEALRTTTYGVSPDYRALASILIGHVRHDDAMVVPTDAGKRFRIGLEAYAGSAGLPDDVLEVDNRISAAELDSVECPASRCLGHPQRLWVGCIGPCGDPLSSLRPADAATIRRAGYAATHVWHVEDGAIALFEPTA